MGTVPRPLIAEHVPLGDAIGCIVPADYLVTAGISHWGAYAIVAAVALLRDDWSASMRSVLDPSLDQSVVEAMVREGPAVDGVTLMRAPTIDGIDMAVHHEVLAQIATLTRPG